MADWQAIAREVDALPEDSGSSSELMSAIVAHLQRRLPKYNWVGYYMIDKDNPNALVLGPYVGAPTPHTRIALNQGICGAAASSGKTIIVDDVNSDPRYLSCSIETRSEIVAPVFVNGQVVGELDIDSHDAAAFTSDDRKLVEHCAALVGHYLEQHA